jgi:serine/threonine protein kinase
VASRKKFCPICLQEWEGDDGFCRACGVQLVRSDPEDITGFLVDRKYRVDAIIARGGMGVVYRATQVYLNRDVALKVLRADLPKDANATRRFLLEARAASSLRSPHTVTVHDFGISDDGRLYFAMELLDGEPLDDLIARGPLPWQRVVGIILQVCDSLGEAHAQRIFHRDIKPANIFLARTTGGTDFVKVLDFGIARIGEETGLTKPGGLCGTPEYASPEQAIGGEADHRSDIYSLGIVAYEMLSGSKPFTGAGPKILMAHVRERPESLGQCCPEGTVPQGLDDVVQSMLEKLPSRRPQSTTELAETLHRLASAQGIPTHLAVPILARSEQKTSSESTPLPTPLKSILEQSAASGDGKKSTVEEELDEIIDARVTNVTQAPLPPPLAREAVAWEDSGEPVPVRTKRRFSSIAVGAALAGALLAVAAWVFWPHGSDQTTLPATVDELAKASSPASMHPGDDLRPETGAQPQPTEEPLPRPASLRSGIHFELPKADAVASGGRTAFAVLLDAAREGSAGDQLPQDSVEASGPEVAVEPVDTDKSAGSVEVAEAEKAVVAVMVEDTREPVDEEKVADTKKPVDKEKVADTKKPVDKEKVADTKKPVDKQKVADTKRPVDKQKVADTKKPVDKEKVADTKKPVDKEKVADMEGSASGAVAKADAAATAGVEPKKDGPDKVKVADKQAAQADGGAAKSQGTAKDEEYGIIPPE